MAKKDVNEKKQSKNYFKEMKAELKKVVWPTPKELFNNTVAVIGFVLIIGIIVFVLDFCFDNVNKYGIVKFQEKIQSTFRTTDSSSNSDENSAIDSIEDTTTEDSDNESENVEDGVEAQFETENNASAETTQSNE